MLRQSVYFFILWLGFLHQRHEQSHFNVAVRSAWIKLLCDLRIHFCVRHYRGEIKWSVACILSNRRAWDIAHEEKSAFQCVRYSSPHKITFCNTDTHCLAVDELVFVVVQRDSRRITDMRIFLQRYDYRENSPERQVFLMRRKSGYSEVYIQYQ